MNIPKLHIANTFFEWELDTDPHGTLSGAFARNSVFLQLQFLPWLYASAEDGILVTGLPGSKDPASLKNSGMMLPKIYTFQDVDFGDLHEIESWGPSRLIAAFAKEKGLFYAMPPWEVVRTVNSKEFSFTAGPKLPHATLLTEEAQAELWLGSFPGRKVLKTCFGVSGTGHLIIDSPVPKEKIRSFLRAEWKKGLPVIAEPFVHRILDFSTQWHIGRDQQVVDVGATLCFNDDRGQYRSSVVGEESLLFAQHQHHLIEHRKIAAPILQKIAQAGFFGNIGIDAMLYTSIEDPDKVLLHPVVEINGRKTMGWAALAFQRKYHPGRCIGLHFAPGTMGDSGLLPQSIMHGGKSTLFRRNLHVDIYTGNVSRIRCQGASKPRD